MAHEFQVFRAENATFCLGKRTAEMMLQYAQAVQGLYTSSRCMWFAVTSGLCPQCCGWAPETGYCTAKAIRRKVAIRIPKRKTYFVKKWVRAEINGDHLERVEPANTRLIPKPLGWALIQLVRCFVTSPIIPATSDLIARAQYSSCSRKRHGGRNRLMTIPCLAAPWNYDVHNDLKA